MRAIFIFIVAVAALGMAAIAGAGNAPSPKTLTPVMEKPTKKAAALPGPAAFAIVLIGLAGVIRRKAN